MRGIANSQDVRDAVELLLGRSGNTSEDVGDMLLRGTKLAGDLAVRHALAVKSISKSSALRAGWHSDKEIVQGGEIDYGTPRYAVFTLL